MASSRKREMVIGAIAVFLLLTVWMVMRGGGYHVNVLLESASQLVKGNEVTVGGQAVGIIEEITLTSDNQAKIHVKIDKGGLTPLHEGSTATVRLSSLSGVANRYLSIVPGPNNKPKIPDDGTIEAVNSNPTVDLDQLFNSLDQKTRQEFQNFIRGSGNWYEDDPDTPLAEAVYANRAVKYFAPFFSSGAYLAKTIGEDDQLLKEFLVQSSQSAATFAAEKEHLASLFVNLTRFSRAVASESEQLDAALAVLPQALNDGTEVFQDLRPAMAAVEKLSDEAVPATKDLAPFLRDLRPLLRNAKPTVNDLNNIVRKSGKNNDLYELLSGQPTLTKKARTAFPSSLQAMQSGQILLDFLRPYTPELTSWLTHFGQIAANYDGNGHYVRVQPVVGRFADTGAALTPLADDQSLSGYPTSGVKRCPGSGQQAASDGSNPFLDGGIDCDPSIVTPGP